MGKDKDRNIEQQEKVAVDWDSAIDDDDGSDDANKSARLMIRDGLARLDLDRPPFAHDVGLARGALAIRWRMPAEQIKSFTLRSLRSSSATPKGPEYTVHFIDESRWPELVVESDAQAILVDLFWRLGGEYSLARMVQQSPWLATKSPSMAPDAIQQNMVSILKGMKMTYSWGMIDHMFAFLAKESTKNSQVISENDDPDIIRWNRPFHPVGVDALDIQAELEGFVITNWDPTAKRAPAEDTLVKPPLSQLQHSLYSEDDVRKAKRRAEESGSTEHARRIGIFYDRMLKIGGVRPLAPAPAVSEVLALVDAFPNFSHVADFVAEQIALASLHSGPAHFSPILLGGLPGIGKTQFAFDLAKVVQTTFTTVGFSSATAGWILSGSSPLWNGSKAGKIFETLHNGTGNPLILLDEIDKAGGGDNNGNNRWDPLGSMYQLLEQASAKSFSDEYVDIPIDASRVMWVATANDRDRIPKPILSRFTIFLVPAPTQDQVRAISARIYSQMLAEPFGQFFDPELSDAILNTLGSRSPRELRLVLRRALGKAAIAGRRSITVADLVLDEPEQPTRRSIGFCA